MADASPQCDSNLSQARTPGIKNVDQITSLDKFRVPIGNQEIELQQVAYESGGPLFLRLRIRERTRFTVFDIDPLTAARWADQMARWAHLQLASVPGTSPAAETHESQPDRHGDHEP